MPVLRFYCLVLLLMVVQTSIANKPSLYFTKITSVNGLSHNKVNCILQDRRGFMWFGTDDGLNRYDGNKFVVFKNDPSNASSPSGNIVTNLLEDKDGIIWIATADGGLTKYNYRESPGKQFRQFKHSITDSTSIPVNIINAVIEDPFGFLWLATSGNGVLRFNKHDETFQSLPNWGRTILSLCMDAEGKIWVGREGRGLLKIDPVTFQVEADERYNNVYNVKLPHMVVTTIFRDSRNNMWLGSWDKVVYRYNTKLDKKDVFGEDGGPFSFGKDDPVSFTEDLRRRIWIGGKYGGLHIYDPADNAFYHYTHDPARDGTLTDNKVNAIYRDRGGIIWLGTNSGISIHNPAQQQFEQTFLPVNEKEPPVTVYDFFEMDDKLLIGTSNGIYLQSPGGDIRHIPLKYKGQALAATKFFRAKDNTVYLGTDLSLFRFDAVKFSLQLLPNTEKDIVMRRIIESRVVSILEDTIDDHPVLLVSPYGHYLAYYDLVTKQWISRQDTMRNIVSRMGLRDHMVRRFFKSSNGKIWLANTKAGLGEWVKNSFPVIHYYANIPTRSESISNNHVYDIAEDGAGNLWISTYGGGLHYFNTSQKKFVHIQSSHNLSEGIQTDKYGNVWMVANGNLHKYDVRKRSYATYSLPDVEKTGGIRGYIYKRSDGRMIVAGTNYFILFHPDSVQETTSQPKVYLTDFKVFNTSYNQLLSEKKIVLRHTQNFFSFEFAAPSYDGPVHYSWKLEGVDPDWVNTGSANYTNLSGGDYVFKVRATTRPGIWSNDIAAISVRIIPPFWKTAWFFIVCALLLMGAVYAIYRYRINELLKRQAIRNKIAQDLHDNVGSTLSSISVYSQVAKIHNAQGNRNDLQDVLLKIADTSSEMISEMNDIVWTINPRNDSMEKILQRMESFAKPLLHTQQIQFKFQYDAAVMNLNLEMEKRKNFYLIFKEAVNNALKYSGCKKMEVYVHYRHKQIELLVQDDGIGFDKTTVEAKTSQSLTGNGLGNMARRAKEMGGACTIESQLGHGTMVHLKFPVT